MGAVVRHRAPSMSSIVRTGIRTRDFTPQLLRGPASDRLVLFPQMCMTGQVRVRVTPLTPWMWETTILPRASMLAASTIAMTSDGPATGTAEPVPSISATSRATRTACPTSVWISTYARTIVRHPRQSHHVPASSRAQWAQPHRRVGALLDPVAAKCRLGEKRHRLEFGHAQPRRECDPSTPHFG